MYWYICTIPVCAPLSYSSCRVQNPALPSPAGFANRELLLISGAAHAFGDMTQNTTASFHRGHYPIPSSTEGLAKYLPPAHRVIWGRLEIFRPWDIRRRCGCPLLTSLLLGRYADARCLEARSRRGKEPYFNIALTATFVTFHEVAAYAMSKAGLGSLMRSLSAKWSKLGVCLTADSYAGCSRAPLFLREFLHNGTDLVVDGGQLARCRNQ